MLPGSPKEPESLPRDPLLFLHIVTPSAAYPPVPRLPERGATLCGKPEGVTKTENNTDTLQVRLAEYQLVGVCAQPCDRHDVRLDRSALGA